MDMAGNKQMFYPNSPTRRHCHVKVHLRPAGLEIGAEARCLLTKETSRRRAIALTIKDEYRLSRHRTSANIRSALL